MKSLNRHSPFVGLMLAALVAGGCSQSADSGGSSEMDDLARMLDQPKQQSPPSPAVEPEPAPPPVAAAPAEGSGEELRDREHPAEPAAQPDQTVGIVGKKQRRNTIQGPLRYYGAISNARILFHDRALGWQIQKSMDVYVNTHDGKYPQTTEEFMREIIEPNMIELPELRPQQEYFYDPTDHELKIGEWFDEPDAEDATADEAATAE
jgi:hypothetical protein